ncbi:DUF305 domain-containing protein [Microbacterium sp. LRZ72]|uniref:DUF305 domain-containing protein n=1 Tax=Microbacterium sp. LRZ72 TaxID=2942481 RepID=UPI0029BC2F8B|nr:DUF305 domain-containing protein [Microbacterium sp. LRZ72]MDX2376834.1 DUF305 domain-containing protein [Microbacterium sp. LRZ72]
MTTAGVEPDAEDAGPHDRIDEDTAPRSGPPRWLLVVLAILAVGALAFAAGRFSTFGALQGAAAPTSDSAEAGFARDMQVHHAQAVEMAMSLYQRTDDPELRVLAYDIATAQSAQIGQMYSWLVGWGVPPVGDTTMAWMTPVEGHDHGGTASGEPLTGEQMRAAMGMASDAELDAFENASGTAADCMFLDLMTTHHEGAIEMVDAVLELGDEPRVLRVAQSMKDTQRFEIEAMAASAERLGCG